MDSRSNEQRQLLGLRRQPISVGSRTLSLEILTPPDYHQTRLLGSSFSLDVQNNEKKLHWPVMAGHLHRESGKRKHHSSELAKPEESSGGSSICSSAMPEEVLTLQNYNIENEGVATSCKRVKPNLRHTKKHSSQIEIICGNPKSSDAEASSPQLRTLTVSPESVNTDASDNQREGVLGKLADVRKKAVGAVTSKSLMQIYNRSSSSLPDYGGFDSSATPITMPYTLQAKPAFPGGHQPRNTLGAGKSPVSISRLGPKVESENKKKPFNLQTDEYYPEPFHPLKKQKLDKRAASSVADLDSTEGRSNMIVSQSSVGSRTENPVQSVSSTPRQSSMSTNLGNIEEYSGLEKRMGFARSTKRNRSSEYFGFDEKQGQSAISEAKSHAQTLDYDPIEDSGAEVFGGYKGSSFFGPARPKSFLVTSDRRRGSQGISTDDQSRSQYFSNSKRAAFDAASVPLSKKASGVVDSTQNLDRERRNSSGSIQSLPNNDEAIEIDDDDSIDQIEPQITPATQKERPSLVMKEFARPKSESLSRAGDIQSYTFRKAGGSTGNKLPYSARELDRPFHLAHFQTSSVMLAKEDQLQNFELHVDHNLKEFHLLKTGLNIPKENPSSTIRAEKANNLYYSIDNEIVILHNARDHGVGGAAKVLLMFDTRTERGRFMTIFEAFNPLAHLLQRPSDLLKKIFSRQIKDLTIEKSRKQHAEKASDIQLLEARELKNNMSSDKPIVAKQAANTSRRRQSDANIHATPISNEKVSQKLRVRSSPERSATFKSLEMGLDYIYDNDGELGTFRKPNMENARDSPEIHYQTRSSTSSRLVEHPAPAPSRLFAPLGWTLRNPEWESDWKADPFIFPINGKKQTPVDRRDIERLDEGEFLNDNLISFYLRFLERRVELQTPHLVGRVLFMSTFFYLTLTKGAGRHTIDYDAVKRWTAKIKLFEYDYIVVPINEHTHWYLAIICNTPRLLPQPLQGIDSEHPRNHFSTTEKISSALPGSTENDIVPEPESASPDLRLEQMSLEDGIENFSDWPNEEVSEGAQNHPPFTGNSVAQLRHGPLNNETLEATREANSDSPHEEITHPTSIAKKAKRRSHAGRKYDPKEPRIITLDSLGSPHSPTCANLKDYLVREAKDKLNTEISPGSLGMTVKNIRLQDNFCDCGVFLLAYVEKFLKSPDIFVQRILKGEMDVESDWSDFDASHMRNEIRDRIIELQGNDGESQDRIIRGLNFSKPSVDNMTSDLQATETTERVRLETAVGKRNSDQPLNDPAATAKMSPRQPEVERPQQLRHPKSKSANQNADATAANQQKSEQPDPERDNVSNIITSDDEISSVPEHSPAVRSLGSSPRHTKKGRENSECFIDLASGGDVSQNEVHVTHEVRSGSHTKSNAGSLLKDSERRGNFSADTSRPVQAAPDEVFEDIMTRSEVQQPSTPPRELRRRSNSNSTTPLPKITTSPMLLRSSPRNQRESAPEFLSRDERKRNGTWKKRQQ